MNSVNSVVSPLSFVQQQLALETASTPAVQNLPSSTLTVTHARTGHSVGRDSASIEYEMFADEGDRFNRDRRGRLSSKLFKKKKPPVADNTKAGDAGKLIGVDANKPGSSGATAADKDIAKEQAEFKPEVDQTGKLGQEDIVIVEPTTVSLAVPKVSVNSKAVSPFSSDTLKKAKKEFEEATAAPEASKAEKTTSEEVKSDADTSLKPEKNTISDTKKALIVVGIGAVVTPAVTAIAKIIEKHLGENVVTKFQTSLAETKIIDQLQKDVFDTVNILTRLTKGKAPEPDYQWALKSDAERMTSLESITLQLESGFGMLAAKFEIPFSFGVSRIEEPDVEGRAKIIEARLAAMIAITQAVTLKLNALAA
ncbi:hypothetical protein ACMSI6_08535 [Pseudomonas antarctica]|uniref:Uncharacterized protein n=1 Tax=Pseudomonas antarctica TaxID=219572 RepID=A0A1G9X152_9PSED|nr:hypothetical protein [Pseudomonas antarctica]KAF2409709.1 hypothetical protein PSAN_21240 [Pseudomonas antarctica]SDM90176.1 hypothetical protein SAMN04490179_1497 [Pseudomonas antarctica]